MRELFIKYLDNECSPAEVTILLAHFNIDKNELILRRLIIEWLEENEDDVENNKWKTILFKARNFINMKLNIVKLTLIDIFRKTIKK